MKIRKPGDGVGSVFIADHKGTSARISVQKTNSFQPLLQENQTRHVEKELRQLMTNIADLGERLNREPNLATLISYKKSVAEFLNMIIDSSYKFEKQNYFDKRWGRHNIYALVKKVNTKLESLTQEVLNQESENLLAISLVDEIRGLLMDFFV